MRPSKRKALSRDDLGWVRFPRGGGDRISASHRNRQLKTARRLLRGLYGEDAVPGMMLGDEVGMGKTYVSLAVVASVCRHQPDARVVILAHNEDMARTWRDRWDSIAKKTRPPGSHSPLPEGQRLNKARDMGKKGVYFGSYETYKRVSTDSARMMLEALLEGSGIHDPTRRRLRHQLFGTRARGDDLCDALRRPSITTRERFVARHYDCHTKGWKSWWSAAAEIRRIVLGNSRSRRPIDLLIVDEAHKLESDQRTVFMSEVLDGRVKRALFVTATPFALRVAQLIDRLNDIYDVTEWPGKAGKLKAVKGDVKEFADTVGRNAGAAHELRERVEASLGRYLVRSRWPERISKQGPPRRDNKLIPHNISRQITETDAFAILALETAYRRISNCGERVHRASYRETLCSSYSAVRKSMTRKDLEEKSPVPRFLKGLDDFIPRNSESPKFQNALSFLVQSARGRHKVVVFCKRTATVERMRREIHAAFARIRKMHSMEWQKVQRRLPQWKKDGLPQDMEWDECIAWLRFAVHHHVRKKINRRNWQSLVLRMKEHGCRAAGDNYLELLRQTWGRGHRADWVAELSGSMPDENSSDLSTREHRKRGRSKSAVRFAFNLPGPPYVLVCTSVAREGIDLHHWCHKLLQYDLEWNPAWMEQQVGRVDRINSLAHRMRVPVEVYYAHLPGTYEEYIADEVKRRCEMLRLVLGAGEWLADKPEDQKRIAELERYQLDFEP